MDEHIEFILSQPYFKNKYSQRNCELLDVKAPITNTWEKSKSNLYLCTGDNASGRVFL